MTNKINGINVSESVSSATNNNIYYSQIAVDELQNTIKRLQEENEELKTYIQKMDKPEIKAIDSEIALKNIELQQENEELQYSLKTQCITCKRELEICRILVINDKLRQALEEIREMLKKSMSLKSNAYNHFINVEKAIDKINEVLNVEND